MTDAPSLDETARKLADRVAALPARTPRLLVAVAGPPASGKTTLAERLAEMLCEGGHEARHVPMDGFHL
ncbi:nucleoside/nucleotide kinase family protein, partial [bacterium LRH843]|nr:nucleoside/nucleotide kinase family protein [bacterium LRH843]